jgi:predicted dinucleotide-binding enzyme
LFILGGSVCSCGSVLRPPLDCNSGGNLQVHVVSDMVYCGDNERAKAAVAHLIRDVGFNPVDVGALGTARYVEPFVMLVAGLAYDGPEGPEVAYRFERLRT